MDELIKNINTITINDPCLVERAKNAELFVIHTIFRPLQFSELPKQDDSLSLRKIAGEGQLAKINTCLEWCTQTRSLRVFLLAENR